MMSYDPAVQYHSKTVREKRDALLAASDWTQLKDVPVEVSEQWQEYRQALRDLPQQEGFPFQVVFPNKPTGNNNGN